MMKTAIVDRAIDPCAVLDAVAGTHNGAGILFVGTVRDVNDGSPVSGLDYSAYTTGVTANLASVLALGRVRHTISNGTASHERARWRSTSSDPSSLQ